MARASHVQRMSPNRHKAEPQPWPPGDAKWTTNTSSSPAMPMNYQQCSPAESCTDTSEDSVDVRVGPVTLPSAAYSASLAGRRNKRKPAEPRRVTGGKRFRWDSDSDCSSSNNNQNVVGEEASKGLDSDVDVSEDDDGDDDDDDEQSNLTQSQQVKSSSVVKQQEQVRTDGSSRSSSSFMVPPITPRTCRGSSSGAHCSGERSRGSNNNNNNNNNNNSNNKSSSSLMAIASSSSSTMSAKQKQRNYKNMTRERRIEANARERTRVHTISAAFENLRRAVPAYSCNQKLSKLAILRIACSYILALGSLNEEDYSREQDGPSFGECVDLCTTTIQNEGRARRRKD